MDLPEPGVKRDQRGAGNRSRRDGESHARSSIQPGTATTCASVPVLILVDNRDRSAAETQSLA